VDIDIIQSRRKFLGTASSVVAGGLAATACSALRPGTAVSPLTPLKASPAAQVVPLTAARRGAPTPADWTALARDLSGPLIRPADARYALGGRINQVKPNATAFVHRNALFDAQYTTNWSIGAGATGIANQHAWLRSFWQSMRPYASGQAYQNYIDPDLTAGGAWKQAYYGANYARLSAVKKKYDPGQLFKFPQAVLSPRGPPLRNGSNARSTS
jgi:hypothetical protein